MKDQYYKYLVWVLVAVLLFILIRGCGKGNTAFFGCSHRDTIRVKYDSVITITKRDTVYTPELVGVSNTVHVHDTLEIPGATTVQQVFISEDVDSAKILKDYFAARFYADTQRLQRGTIIIRDTVTQNRIVSRRLQTSFADSFITKTIVLSQPKKMIFYLTASALGNLHNPVDGVGTGFALKGMNDVIIGGQVKFQVDKRPMYELTYSLPIKLTRKE